MSEDDFKEDELIDIRLPRKQYETLKLMIEREQAYNWFINTIKNNWLWVVGGGVLSIWLLYDKFHILFSNGVK
jgi:hypothetical protein